MSQKRSLDNILFTAGVRRSLVGYYYFTEAVSIVSENSDSLKCVRNNVYSPIARKYGTTIPCVEKGIERVRDKIMENGGTDLLYELTGYRFPLGEKPFPRELIEIFARYLEQ